ncbi:MAG TPA: bacillithiol system redox-active protein YtxJ [Ferruginibacter sp.]|nr:bacillithiol system redox-active protein YtxJ [Chitinophagaceae bacterium]HRI26013.1 bacillithiol system redox-active protein YtxJ [Ferruginibacter sp.]
MNWIELNHPQQLSHIRELSRSRPQVIFKHSTRCSLSSVAKDRLERTGQPDSADFYFLDLLKFRSLSDQVAEDFAVYHESPQVLLIKDAECIYEESHGAISMNAIIEQLALN